MIKLKKDSNTILKISKKREENGDIIGALSILHSDKPYGKNKLELYYQKGLLYINNKNYNSAIDILLIYTQLGNKIQRCKGYNAIGYSFLKLENYILADAFFNLQLDESVKQICHFDDEMYEYFASQDKIERFKVITPYKEEFKEGVFNFEFKDYNKALEYFNQIPSSSKYYQETLLYKSKIYFKQKEIKKGLAFFEEYYNNSNKVSVYNYYEFITILANNNLDEYKYYLNNLLMQKEFEGKDNLLVADLVFKFSENYNLVFDYLNKYEKQVKVSYVTLSLRALAYLYDDKLEFAKENIKKAYLFSNLSKFKYLLLNTTKEAYMLYPKNLYAEYKNFIENQLKKSKINRPSYSKIKDIFEVAVDINKKDFWNLFLDYIEKINNSITDFYVKSLLVVPEVDFFIKIRAKKILAKRGFIGTIIELGKIPSKLSFIKLNMFKTEKFKQAFLNAYIAIYIIINSNYLKKAILLEEKIIDKLQDFSECEISAFILYYLFKNGLRAKSYKDLFGVSKGRVLEMSKIFNMKIKK